MSSAGSKASASDRVMAVIMLTQRICSGVIGRLPSPMAMAASNTSDCPALVGKMNRIDLRRLS
ncbi:hypothetical protein D3C81_2315650 [compost metagenome]